MGATTGLSYDPAGRLYQSGSTRFLYDGVQAIGEYDTAGNLQKRYVPGLGLDDVVTAYEGSGYDWRWLLADERGSVISITDGAANALATNTYDEYGVPGSGNSGRFQYTGQMWLPQAQLYHYRARAYAPQLGRFMQTDPIGYAAGANVYAYVGADPMNWGDPMGEEQVEIGDRTYQVCVDQPVFPDGEHGWWDSETVTVCYVFSRPRPPSHGGGGVGGSALRGGLYGGMPGAGFVGDASEELRQAQADFIQNYRNPALERNSWMVDYALAPLMFVEAPVLLSGRAAGVFAKACNCFVQGTEVQTSEGLKPIEQIVVGDRVLARDDATGETVFKPVLALIAGSTREIWEVTVETTDSQGRVQREPIGTTDEHPWRTAAGAWLETRDLTPGTELVSADGDRAVVITVLKTDRVESTYNFEVEGFHTYFVGESGVWVHNACNRFFRGTLRREILKAGSKCAYCGNAATQVDHVIAFSRGGPTSLSNGVPACAPCNASKGTQVLRNGFFQGLGDDLSDYLHM